MGENKSKMWVILSLTCIGQVFIVGQRMLHRPDHKSLCSAEINNERGFKSIHPFYIMRCTGVIIFLLNIIFEAVTNYFVHLALC